MPCIHSYVVRYDSGFAPNPFYGYCTLATCKPDIRRSAQIGDWIVGTGSNNQAVRLGGRLCYAMRVTDVLTFDEYNVDPRFQTKKPYRTGSRKQTCGDNIYFRNRVGAAWSQRDSFHTRADGKPNQDHIRRDTGVNRVLVSDDFVYFGGAGPKIPASLRDGDGRLLVKTGIGRCRFDDETLVAKLEAWLASLAVTGYQAAPHEWLALQ